MILACHRACPGVWGCPCRLARTFAKGVVPFAHSMLPALRKPCCARPAPPARRHGHPRRLRPTEARKDRVCPAPRGGVDGKRRHGCRSAAVFERAKSRMDAASVRREGVGRPEPVGRRGRPRTSAERRAKITRDPHQPPNHVRRARPSSSPMLRRASAKSALLAPRSRSVNVIGTSTIRPPARCTRQRKSSWNA